MLIGRRSVKTDLRLRHNNRFQQDLQIKHQNTPFETALLEWHRSVFWSASFAFQNRDKTLLKNKSVLWYGKALVGDRGKITVWFKIST